MGSTISIEIPLVKRLVTSQFPQWKDLPIRPVAKSGWDNRTFHLGETMLVRMPSAPEYAHQVEKEYRWLPKLAPFLPLEIPTPLALGRPGEGYPFHWSINRWIEGESASSKQSTDVAVSLADFLLALERIDPANGPLTGADNFYRGGSLNHYDSETKRSLAVLKNRIDTRAAEEVWETALSTSWKHPPVWVHGDISPGNLLMRKGKLCAVIDFGQLAIGDPACDLAIAWTFFKDESRKVFQEKMQLDKDTWARARGWTLWKALIVAAGFTNPNNNESAQCWKIIEEVLKEH